MRTPSGATLVALDHPDVREALDLIILGTGTHNFHPKPKNLAHAIPSESVNSSFPIEFTPDVKRALLLLHGWTIFSKARDGGKRFDYYYVCPACDDFEFDSIKNCS